MPITDIAGKKSMKKTLTSTTTRFGDQGQHLMQERPTPQHWICFKKERAFPRNWREPSLCHIYALHSPAEPWHLRTTATQTADSGGERAPELLLLLLLSPPLSTGASYSCGVRRGNCGFCLGEQGEGPHTCLHLTSVLPPAGQRTFGKLLPQSSRNEVVFAMSKYKMPAYGHQS